MELEGDSLPLASVPWQRLDAGASAGMLQRFCRAIDATLPHHHHHFHIIFLLLVPFSLE